MNRINTAVIVAAGLSSRLYPLTLKTPKCLLEINNKSLLTRSIESLHSNNIDNIHIVTGFESEQIKKHCKDFAKTIYNPFFKYCNNMGSLWFAKNAISNTPFLYLHADIIYDHVLLETLLNSYNQETISLLVDFCDTDEEAMKVETDSHKFLVQSNKEIPPSRSHGEWIGIAAIYEPQKTFRYIESLLKNDHLSAYDTMAFSQMAKDGYKIKCVPTKNQNWMEIDFKDDFNKAKEMFNEN